MDRSVQGPRGVNSLVRPARGDFDELQRVVVTDPLALIVSIL